MPPTSAPSAAPLHAVRLPAGPIKRLHVNQWCLAGADAGHPCITIKMSRARSWPANTYGHLVLIAGPADVVQSILKPLDCGARVWLETHAAATALTRGPDGELPPGAEEERDPTPPTRIHIRQKAIALNRDRGEALPCVHVLRADGSGMEPSGLRIHGPSRVVQVGRAIYLATHAPVEAIPSRDSIRSDRKRSAASTPPLALW